MKLPYFYLIAPGRRSCKILHEPLCNGNGKLYDFKVRKRFAMFQGCRDDRFPVYQNFTGNQLAAPVLFKVSLSFMF